MCSGNSTQSSELRVLEDLSVLFPLEVKFAELPHVSGELVSASGSPLEPEMPKVEVGFPLFWLFRSLFASLSLAQKMLIVCDDIRRYFSVADVSESSFFAPLRCCSRVRPASSFAGRSRLC